MPGVRQIAARAKARAARNQRPSELAGLLVRLLTLQSLTPALAQQISTAALHDMDTEREYDCTDELRKLSSLGSFGTTPNHGRTQLFNSVLQKPDLKSTRMQIPLKDIANPNGYTMEFQDLFLPHLWLHQMWTYYRDSWTRLVCASQEVMRSFWDAMEGSPFSRCGTYQNGSWVQRKGTSSLVSWGWSGHCRCWKKLVADDGLHIVWIIACFHKVI